MKTTKLLLTLCAIMLTAAISWGQTITANITNGITGGQTPVCGLTPTITINTVGNGYVTAPTYSVSISGGAAIAGVFAPTGMNASGSFTLTLPSAGTYTISVGATGGTIAGGVAAQNRSTNIVIRDDAAPMTPVVTAAPSPICGGLSALVRVTNPVAGFNYAWSAPAYGNGSAAGMPMVFAASGAPSPITGASQTVSPSAPIPGAHTFQAVGYLYYPAQSANCLSAYSNIATVQVDGPLAPTGGVATINACAGAVPVATSNYTYDLLTIRSGFSCATGSLAWFNSVGTEMTNPAIVGTSAPILTSVPTGSTIYSARCKTLPSGCLSTPTTFTLVGIPKPTTPQLAASSVCLNSTGGLPVSILLPSSGCQRIYRYDAAAFTGYIGATTTNTVNYSGAGPAITTATVHTYPTAATDVSVTYTCATVAGTDYTGAPAVYNASPNVAGECESSQQVLTVQVLNGPGTAVPAPNGTTRYSCVGASSSMQSRSVSSTQGCPSGQTVAWYQVTAAGAGPHTFTATSSPMPPATPAGTVTQPGTVGTTTNTTNPSASVGTLAAGTYYYAARCEVGTCYGNFGGAQTLIVSGSAPAAPTLSATSATACLNTAVTPNTVSPTTFSTTATCATAGTAVRILDDNLATLISGASPLTFTNNFLTTTGSTSYYFVCYETGAGGCTSNYTPFVATVTSNSTSTAPSVTVLADNIDNNVFCDNQAKATPGTVNILGTKILANASCSNAIWTLTESIGSSVTTYGPTAVGAANFTYTDFMAIKGGDYMLNRIYQLTASCGGAGCAGSSSNATSTAFIFIATTPPLIQVTGTNSVPGTALSDVAAPVAPDFVNICRGSLVQLQETSGHCAGTVRWYASTDNGTAYSAVAAGVFTSASLSPFVNAVRFRAVCENATCNSLESWSVLVNIRDLPAVPTLTATPSPMGCQPVGTNVNIALSGTCAATETVLFQRSANITFPNTAAEPTTTVMTGDILTVVAATNTAYYRVKCTNIYGCSSTSIAQAVTVTTQASSPGTVRIASAASTPAIAATSGTINICAGTTVDLSATGCLGGVITWYKARARATNATTSNSLTCPDCVSSVVGTGNALTFTPSVTLPATPTPFGALAPVAPALYGSVVELGIDYYKAECNINGCSSPMSATVGVRVYPALNSGTFKIEPTANPGATTAIVCPSNALSGTTVNLRTVGCTGAIDWYAGIYNSADLSNRIQENSDFYNNAPVGTYTATCTNGSCTITTSFTVSASTNPNPVVMASAATTGICAGGAITLTASSNPAASTYVWNSTGTDLLSPSNINSSSISTMAATTNMSGTYTVLMQIGSCSFVAQQILDVSGGNILDLNIINLGAPVAERIPGASIAEWNIAPRTPSSLSLANSTMISPTIYSTVTPVDGGGNAANGAPRYWTAEAKTCPAIAPRSMKFTIATVVAGTGTVSGVTYEASSPWFLFNNVGYRKLWSISDATWGFGTAGGWPEGSFSITVDAYAGPTTTGNAYGTPTGALLASKTFYFMVDPNPGARTGITGSKDESNETVAIVAPNPVGNTMKVEINGLAGQEVKMNFTDLAGRSLIMKSIRPSSNKHIEVMDVSRQGNGSYLLQVIGETKKATVKVIKSMN